MITALKMEPVESGSLNRLFADRFIFFPVPDKCVGRCKKSHFIGIIQTGRIRAFFNKLGIIIRETNLICLQNFFHFGIFFIFTYKQIDRKSFFRCVKRNFAFVFAIFDRFQRIEYPFISADRKVFGTQLHGARFYGAPARFAQEHFRRGYRKRF